MKAFKVIVVSVFCLLTLSTWPGTCNYLNDYGEDFDFECQSGECLSYILTSLVTNTTLNLADLQWELSCQKVYKIDVATQSRKSVIILESFCAYYVYYYWCLCDLSRLKVMGSSFVRIIQQLMMEVI